MHFSTSSISLVGQVAIAGTAALTSLSSTLFLHLITHPYVATLVEIKSDGIIPTNVQGMTEPNNERKLIVSRVNIFGNLSYSTFYLSEAVKVTSSVHPFASFKLKDNYFYIFGGKLEDSEIRQKLAKD